MQSQCGADLGRRTRSFSHTKRVFYPLNLIGEVVEAAGLEPAQAGIKGQRVCPFPHASMVLGTGIEPAASGLQSRCSSILNFPSIWSSLPGSNRRELFASSLEGWRSTI